MDINNIATMAFNIFMILTSVIGGASMVVAGLREIAKITPTEKDDEFLTKTASVLNSITVFIDKLALNPAEDKARKIDS